MKQLSQKRADQKLAKELKKERKKANKAQQENHVGMVQDRRTGEWYDPQAKFEELRNSQEFLDVMQRLKNL